MENILLDEHKNVKLIDFGFSTCTITNDKKMKIFCGTPAYMAPEIINYEKNRDIQDHGYSGPPADIWAMGVLLYVLLSGKFPFKAIKNENMTRK